LVPFIPVVSERFNCESLQRTTDPKLQQYLTCPLQPSSTYIKNSFEIQRTMKMKKSRNKKYLLTAG
jgi:hypothetical protein